MKWTIDGERLRAARVAKKWSSGTLAQRSGVSERTVRRIENESVRVTQATALALAVALGGAIEDIASACPEEAVAAPPSGRPKARAPTELEVFVDAEAGLPRPPPLEHAGVAYDVLGARVFQNVVTAFAVHEGRRFAVRGRVKTQRGASPREASLLGSKNGVASRFFLLCPVARGKELRVTVHTAAPEHTLALQDALHADVVALVRVVVAPDGELAAGGGFAFFGVERPKPWALRVEAVLPPG